MFLLKKTYIDSFKNTNNFFVLGNCAKWKPLEAMHYYYLLLLLLYCPTPEKGTSLPFNAEIKSINTAGNYSFHDGDGDGKDANVYATPLPFTISRDFLLIK